MMMGVMIRKWMEHTGHKRSDYFVVGLMPCVAKKEEIARPELRNSDGTQDVDVVLTVREFARLMKRRGVEWSALPGSHSGEYDEPFGKCSGGGALFGASGGVAEAALRVAYSLFAKELPSDPKRKMYGAVRKDPKIGEWIEASVGITPNKPLKRPLETIVVSGGRAIQRFLEDAGLDTPASRYKYRGAKVFVECMACPGGCIGGGGQPASLDPEAVPKRRAAIHAIDLRSEAVSASVTVGALDCKTLFGLSKRKMVPLLMYEPPAEDEATAAAMQAHESCSASTDGFSGSANSSGGSSHSHMSRSIASTLWSVSPILSTLSDASAVDTLTTASRSGLGSAGPVVILYGSQAGFTASHAKTLAKRMRRTLGEHVSLHALDDFPFERIEQTKTVVVLTSTWESDTGLMPSNARKFWKILSSLPLDATGDFFLGTCFAICGFGSTKYKHFCGFALQVHEALARFGAYPIMDPKKIDVDTTDL